LTEHLIILFAALVLDRIIGDPIRLWQRIPHPVALFGSLIDAFDNRFNRNDEDRAVRRRNGIAAIVTLIAFSLAVGAFLNSLFQAMGFSGMVLEAIIVSVFLAQKSLAEYVGAVAKALRIGLPEGRKAVAHIVGRDPQKLDTSGVARAAIESLAENFSDGVVAPAFWYGVFGLPGLLAYKLINTADSMIGHKNSRHEDFGFAAARFDDLVNWPAARLSALLIATAAAFAGSIADMRNALDTAFRDAGLHRSPNAGWPEAAMAASLGIVLAGPRSYDGRVAAEPYVNAEGRTGANASDIDRALVVYMCSCTVLTGMVVVAFVLFSTC
jgi:adenosylcobinamide-phosphate synthase